MTEGKGFTPDMLVIPGSTVLQLSGRELLLLRFALDTFGEQLSRFLLAGLGAEATAPRWRFVVAYTDSPGSTYRFRVDVITHEPSDGSSLLPRGRDPLALIALLRLLPLGREDSTTCLLYEHKDILELLGWDDSEEARREVDGAIDRYCYLTYLATAKGAELERLNLASYKITERPISSFSTVDEEEEGGTLKRISNRVTFSEFVINGLTRRSLLGIDWNRVQSIKFVSARKQVRNNT
jgi:hypothetical protein